ncbi:hypothetical protein BT69DRAFT_1347073 [Atractiella rhizophila]|nr:hypothetical protein BT69DRAFT_1347073 [Atractiella rhizophila]
MATTNADRRSHYSIISADTEEFFYYHLSPSPSIQSHSQNRKRSASLNSVGTHAASPSTSSDFFAFPLTSAPPTSVTTIPTTATTFSYPSSSSRLSNPTTSAPVSTLPRPKSSSALPLLVGPVSRLKDSLSKPRLRHSISSFWKVSPSPPFLAVSVTPPSPTVNVPSDRDVDFNGLASLFKRRHRRRASSSSSQSTNNGVDTPLASAGANESTALSTHEVSRLLTKLGLFKATLGEPADQVGQLRGEQTAFTKKRERQRPEREEPAAVEERDTRHFPENSRKGGQDRQKNEEDDTNPQHSPPRAETDQPLTYVLSAQPNFYSQLLGTPTLFGAGNEKSGHLWANPGGQHGWLPPGAAPLDNGFSPVDVARQEEEMFELALRLSREEERLRRARLEKETSAVERIDGPKSSHGENGAAWSSPLILLPAMRSSSPLNDLKSDLTSPSDKLPPPKPPLIRTSPTSTQSPSEKPEERRESPTSPSSLRRKSSFNRDQWDTARRPGSPSLVSSTTTLIRSPSARASPVGDQPSSPFRATQTNTQPSNSRNSSGSSNSDDPNPAPSSPTSTQEGEGDFVHAEIPHDNFSMYTIEEVTEPTTSRRSSFLDGSTAIPSPTFSAPRPQQPTAFQPDPPSRSTTPTIPSTVLLNQIPVPSPPMVNPQSLENTELPNGERTMNAVFATGVRFGRPGGDTAGTELNPASLEDGQFPRTLELSNKSERELSTWAIEADNWSSLLRFLMWHGESKFTAGQQDIQAEESGHAGAAMVLEFRKDKMGLGVVRLIIKILPSNQTAFTPDFIIPSNKKSNGKGKARTTPEGASTSQVIVLPEELPLPISLNQISVILYTLRQLSSIALSTQAAKGATASYRSLRTLGVCINTLAEEREALSMADGMDEEAEETLYKKLKDRWKGVIKSRREKGSKTPTRSSIIVPPIMVMQPPIASQNAHGSALHTPR